MLSATTRIVIRQPMVGTTFSQKPNTYLLNDCTVIVQQCFRAISVSSTEMLIGVQASSGISFIKEIRHLLTVQDPNALYVFMYCLSSVDPQLWAGTTPEIPSVLEEWEVERIMKALDCEDKLIRKQVAIPAIIAVHLIAHGCYRHFEHFGASTKVSWSRTMQGPSKAICHRLR